MLVAYYVSPVEQNQNSNLRNLTVSVSFFIAKRYIQAQRGNGFLSFITTIAIVGVMLGTAALIITLSVLDGFEREIKEKVVGFTSHIEIQGYQNQPLSEYRRSIDRVMMKIPGVKAISPFAAKEGMIRSRETVDGIFLKGIDVIHDVLLPRQHIIKGNFLSGQPAETAQLVIGNKLAMKLNVDVGDKVVVFALPASNARTLQPRAMQFQLVGIYESGMAEFDDIYAYTQLQYTQKLFQLGDDVSGFDVLVKDINQANQVAKEIQEFLGYPHYARTVFQLYRNLFSWVELQKKLSPILLSLILVVAAINLISTIIIIVFDKRVDVGILKALGATRWMIVRVFIYQGVSATLTGLAIGNALALFLCWIQLKFHLLSLPSDIYYMQSVPIGLHPLNFFIVTAFGGILSMATCLVGSIATTSITPMDSIRLK